MKKLFTSLLLSLAVFVVKGQDSYVDSLQKILNQTKNDSLKVWVYLELADYYNDPKDWLPNNNKALKIAEKHIPSATGKRLKYYYYVKANALSNLGYYYDYIGNKEKTVAYYFEALKLYEKTDSLSGKAAIYSNLGVLYTNQKDYKEAYDCLIKALKLKKKSDPTDLSKNYNNLGVYFTNIGDTNKGLNYYKLSYEAAKKVIDHYDMATTLNNIGDIYYLRKQYRESAGYFIRSVKECLILNDSISAALYMCNLSKAYLGMNMVDSAGYYLKIAEDLANRNDFLELKLLVAENLIIYYELKKDYKNALRYHRITYKLEEDQNDLSDQKESIRQKLEYDHRMKDAKTQMQREEEAKLAEQKFIFISVVLLLSLGLVIVVFSRYRTSQRQKQIIEKQKDRVEEQHAEIKDSINYARYLQNTILPDSNSFFDHLNGGFILSLPKDVVSGDFYWQFRSADTTYIALGDCTGHGVPGAMVSVVCSNALNACMQEVGLAEPGEILNSVKKKVVAQFSASGDTANDGMDIALLKIDHAQKKITFSGANRPCLVINEKGSELIKGDRQPIGNYVENSNFTTIEIPYNPSNTYYLYSDGYADQFGGPDGKKMKQRSLLEILERNTTASFVEQHKALESFFHSWKGTTIQTDDVCVLAVRV